ncbi:MAG: hypothetical protein Rpha_1379 [Candidatus Ruthia sp. Apha_13_S6]|nr:hypothetical protein [Candidatus Ruthia sp. Apha_13_S6]
MKKGIDRVYDSRHGKRYYKHGRLVSKENAETPLLKLQK